MSVYMDEQANLKKKVYDGLAWRLYEMVSWGDKAAPPLYCPIVERDDTGLVNELDKRLIAWAREVGFSADYLDKMRRASFGRLIALAHNDSNDVDRLLLAAEINTALWAVDDYYVDDSAMGAVQEQLPTRLVSAMAAMEPLPQAGPYIHALEAKWTSDPVLMALRSSTDWLRQLASPSQSARLCHATFSLFVSSTAYAEWRIKGAFPPLAHYLAMRQFDSFYISMMLIDVVGGYELAANLFYDPRVCRAARQAGTASTLLNDLYSVDRDAADERPVCNAVLIIAAEQGCSLQQATAQVVDLHNALVRDFEASCRALEGVPSMELQRYLHGLQAWMGGAFAWHDTCPRYRHP